MFPRRYAFLTEELAPFLRGATSILDVGSSNGRLAQKLTAGLDVRLRGVDVHVQPHAAIDIDEYDGKTLPFADRSFDCVMLIDVLHHAEDPVALLKESTRVAKHHVLVKDHYYENRFDWQVLKWADYFGNDPLGITLPYNYLDRDAWHEAAARCKLRILHEKRFTKYSYDPCKHVIYQLAPVAT
jgi:SAM-dependent methyltransferase